MKRPAKFRVGQVVVITITAKQALYISSKYWGEFDGEWIYCSIAHREYSESVLRPLNKKEREG